MKNDDGTDLKNNNGISEATRVRLAAREARKAGLKKGILTVSFLSFLILLTAAIIGYNFYTGEQKKQLALVENQKQSFTELLTRRDSVINEWMLTFDQIEKDLNIVKEKENIITIKSSDKEFSKDKKQLILKDIEYINSLLDQNKKKIASLTAQLQNSGGTIKGLQVKIAELEASMKLRESEVADLKTALVEKDFAIGQLNTRVSEQQLAIVTKDSTIVNQTNEMNKAYITSGTYKDLKEKGVLSKEGGFLGLGRKELVNGNLSDNQFTKIDITQTKSIPVNSKSAKFITEHPTSSYELIRDNNNKIASIEIKDPEQFWKISKYAVVEVKN